MLEIGLSYEQEKIVNVQDTATAYGSGNLNVFATPAMIAFMENTCMKLASKHLDSEQTTVGISVDIQHIKATLPDKKVKCIASLIGIDNRILKFKVDVFDEENKIGEGFHQRAIVNIEKFLSKLK